MHAISTIQTGPRAADLPQTAPRVTRAAQEFEAQMMKELLRPMTSDSLPGCESESGDQPSTGALGEFATEALGRALSARGGFGISERILQALSHSGTNSRSGSGPDQVSESVHKTGAQ